MSTVESLIEDNKVPKSPRSLSLGADIDDFKTRQKAKGGGAGRETPPEDKHNVSYYLMILFGIASLLPWNAVLTSLDFFESKMH